MGTNRTSFLPNRTPKMRETQQLSFGLRLVGRIFEEFQHPSIKTNQCSTLEEKGVIQAVCRRMRKLEAFCTYVATQNFELFSKIQDQNKKTHKKTLFSFPRPIQEYITLMQIWSGRTVPLEKNWIDHWFSTGAYKIKGTRPSATLL
jgi:hypothetical protein